MKTFRRDKLRRLVEQNRIETVSTYHFDDMYGETRGHKTMPCAMNPSDWHDRKEGICYMFAHDFTSKSGGCWLNENGTVSLIVHSNSNYDLLILPESKERTHP